MQQQAHEAELARKAADAQQIGALVGLAQEVAAMGGALRSALPGLHTEMEDIVKGQAASSSPCCCASVEDAHALLMLQAWLHVTCRDAHASCASVHAGMCPKRVAAPGRLQG